MTRRDLADAPSIEPDLVDVADLDLMIAMLRSMRDRLAGGRASAPPATLEQIIADIEKLDDDDRRTVLAFLAPNAPDSHVVTLKIAAAHFGKSQKQCVRRAKELADIGHIFGWKEGSTWYFNLFRPPPGWNPVGRKCPVMSG